MNREYLDLVQRACDTLLKIPGVFSVGLGSKVTGGRNTGRLALSVMVLEKKPPSALAPAEVIPDEIEGLPTDVIEGDPPHLIQDDEDDDDFDTGFGPEGGTTRPIVGGIRIRGARSTKLDGRLKFGTLGCFAITQGKDAGQRVLLTNHHVLADPIGQLHGPSCTGCSKGDAVGNPNVGEQIATVLRGKNDVHMDAAIAILDAGVEFLREIVKDDVLSKRAVITGTRVLNPDNPNDRDFKAHKRGHRTRLTYGMVGAVCATVRISGELKVNQIRIDLPVLFIGTAPPTLHADGTLGSLTVDFLASGAKINDVVWVQFPGKLRRFRITEVRQHKVVVVPRPEADTTPGAWYVTDPNFALSGDSGSVLLDADGKVIGLIWAARARRDGNAWATPIDVIEEEEEGLRIKIDTAIALGDTRIARMAGGAHRTVAGVETDLLRPAAAQGGALPSMTLRERVEQDLLPLPRGREIYDLYFRHHLEVRELLDTNRRVAVVWHRQGGPGIIQSVLDAVRSRKSAIPSNVRGKSWTDRVQAILAVFAEHGSTRLRRDIITFGDEVAGLGGITYPRFLERLGA